MLTGFSRDPANNSRFIRNGGKDYTTFAPGNNLAWVVVEGVEIVIEGRGAQELRRSLENSMLTHDDIVRLLHDWTQRRFSSRLEVDVTKEELLEALNGVDMTTLRAVCRTLSVKVPNIRQANFDAPLTALRKYMDANTRFA